MNQYQGPYNAKPKYRKPHYQQNKDETRQPMQRPQRSPAASLHHTLRCLSAAARPIADTARKSKELLAILQKTPDVPAEAIAAVKDTLAIFEDLHYNCSAAFANLHFAGHSLYKNKVAKMEDEYEGDEEEEEQEIS